MVRTSASEDASPQRVLPPPRWLVSVAAVLGACGGNGSTTVDPSLIRPVTRDDLVITVRERGEVKAARDVRVSSQLEGRATLIFLVPEGTVVAAGDKVAELDTSGIQEKRAVQAINVAKAEALLQQARKNLEVVEKELQSAARTAETRHQIAELRLQKFRGQSRGAALRSNGSAEHAGRSSEQAGGTADDTSGAGALTTESSQLSGGTNQEMLARLRDMAGGDALDEASKLQHARVMDGVLGILGAEGDLDLEMGEMANQILQQIDEVGLARADLELAKKTLLYSQKLAEKGFITTTELEKDDIEHKRQLAKQTLAWNQLMLLVNYTLRETQIGLQLEVENAQLALESVRAANDARRVREAAELKSIEAEHALALKQLENWDRQIANGVLRAPLAGLVVYGRMDWDEPVYEGMEIRERQEVVMLPDVSSMKVELKIPEAQIGKLAVGQRATVRVDAFPNRNFDGRVSHVSTLPDPGPANQMLKVYQATILIDGENPEAALRPGMNGAVTVEVGTIADALNVPMAALERRGNKHFVWRVTTDGPAAAPVELGGNNLSHVQILSGLTEADRVYLVRPPGVLLPAVEPEAPVAGASTSNGSSTGARTSSGAGTDTVNDASQGNGAGKGIDASKGNDAGSSSGSAPAQRSRRGGGNRDANRPASPPR